MGHAGVIAAIETGYRDAIAGAIHREVEGAVARFGQRAIPGGRKLLGTGAGAQSVRGLRGTADYPDRATDDAIFAQQPDQATLPLLRPAIMPRCEGRGGFEGEEVIVRVGGRGGFGCMGHPASVANDFQHWKRHRSPWSRLLERSASAPFQQSVSGELFYDALTADGVAVAVAIDGPAIVASAIVVAPAVMVAAIIAIPIAISTVVMAIPAAIAPVVVPVVAPVIASVAVVLHFLIVRAVITLRRRLGRNADAGHHQGGGEHVGDLDDRYPLVRPGMSLATEIRPGADIVAEWGCRVRNR